MQERDFDPIDAYVGVRIRERRRVLGLSQSDLASALGVTFQQVQKYENGKNRISASKLYETARALRTSVAYFFDGLEGSQAWYDGMDDLAAIEHFLMSAEGYEFVTSFVRVADGPARRGLLQLIRGLASEADEVDGSGSSLKSRARVE
jgi:transcriptional regulator with XRE-family HTH domain